MILTQTQIDRFMQDKLVQVAILKKEGEFGIGPEHQQYSDSNLELIAEKTDGEVIYDEKKIKWQVGRSYAVQSDRGKPGLWYCPKCKAFTDRGEGKVAHSLECETDSWGEPFRITITGISKQRLLDISEEDVEKEGFESKGRFLGEFYKINKHKFVDGQVADWNPEVWVLEGVKKA